MEFNTIAGLRTVIAWVMRHEVFAAVRRLIADSRVDRPRTLLYAMICVPTATRCVARNAAWRAPREHPDNLRVGRADGSGRHPLTGEDSDLKHVSRASARECRQDFFRKHLEKIEETSCRLRQLFGMFTANSITVFTRRLLALPATARFSRRSRRANHYKASAKRIVQMAKKGGPLPRELVTKKSLDNALTLDMAMGGSTNTVLHTLAIAREADVDFTLQRMNELSARTPYICKLAPSGHYHVSDLDRAGGIMAILKRLPSNLLHLDAPTAGGSTLGAQIRAAKIKDDDVIRTIPNAYSKDGGLAVLWGNLAEKGSVVKKGGVAPSMMNFTGKAICFESQEDACAGILGGKVKAGHVVVIRYEGPKGGPGMQEMLAPNLLHHRRGTWRIGRAHHGRGAFPAPRRRVCRACFARGAEGVSSDFSRTAMRSRSTFRTARSMRRLRRPRSQSAARR